MNATLAILLAWMGVPIALLMYVSYLTQKADWYEPEPMDYTSPADYKFWRLHMYDHFN